MEHTIIVLYNEDILTRDLLSKLMEPFKSLHLENGETDEIAAKDGLMMKEIICKIMEPERYENAVNDPRNYYKKIRNTFLKIWNHDWEMW